MRDTFGRRNAFIFGTLVFILDSGLCGGADSMKMLIWSRVVQGIGADGIYDLVNVIITDLVPLRDVDKYLSFTAAIWAIADVLGSLLSGIFSQYVTWRWCFYVNLCISLVSLIITIFFLKLSASKIKDSFLHSTLLKNRIISAIFAAEFFYGANLLGMMYYIPQFFQLVFGDSAVISGVGLLPMMLGLAVGNPLAAWITSKYGVSLYNAIIGAGIEVITSGFMTRWSSKTSRAEAVVLLVFLGAGQGAVMSGLLLSAQVAVEPSQIGIVTGLVIFMQTIGDIFGIAFFAAVYVNELKSLLHGLSLSMDRITAILGDVQRIHTDQYSTQQQNQIIDVYSESMKNGWWLVFACAGACVVCTCFAKQHQFK